MNLQDVILRLAVCYAMLGLATAFRTLYVIDRALDPEAWTKDSASFRLAANRYGASTSWAIITTACFLVVWVTWPAWVQVWVVRVRR